MTVNQLILHPAELDRQPANPVALRARLEALGLLGAPLAFEGREHYRPGERFLELVTFLGCSPVVALGEPGATGDEFAHLQLDGPYPEPQFIAGSNVKSPRCPGCGYRLETWQGEVAAWQADPHHTWRCPMCGKVYAPPRLRWRQCAGFGRYFVRIWGVFEGEAVPSDELLATLADATGFDWQHFYYRD